MASNLILASNSPRRKQLLASIGINPTKILPVNAVETPQKNELPKKLALRLAKLKAELAQEKLNESAPYFLLAADTVVAVGRRILPKAENETQAKQCLQMLSGRAHRVFTGISIIAPNGKSQVRAVETRVQFKRLSKTEIEKYINAGEWQGVAGGYAIQGLAAIFVHKIIGSYSNVVGLPLFETAAMLYGLGYKDN